MAFLRLPDGNLDGSGFASTGYESLEKLWRDSISTIDTIDGSSSYTKAALISTLAGLMSSFQPDQVNTQDYVGSYGDGDHSDHHTTAYLVQVALQEYATPYSFTGYEDYSTSSRAANVTGNDLTIKQNAFYTYGQYDVNVCNSAASCAGSDYELWLQRQYTVGSGTGGGSTNLALSATATASSEDTSTGQTANKAIDGVIDGYPGDSTREWATVGGGAGSWLKLSWASPQTVGRIVLYDRPNLDDQITGGNIQFSDGSSVAVGTLNNDGSAVTISFPAKTITSLQLNITSVSASTVNVGLAEIQVYSDTVGGGSTNLALLATATASSEDTSTSQTADKAIDGIIDGYPGDSTREWATVGGGAGSWLKLTWASPQTVSRIVLYDRPNLDDQITGGNIQFSDGSSVPVGTLNNDGSAVTISFPAKTITSLQLNITSVSASTVNVGLAEIQVYDN